MDFSLPGSSPHGIFQARIRSGLPFLPPGDLPNPGIEPMSPASPTLAGGAPYLLILNPELIYLHLN